MFEEFFFHINHLQIIIDFILYTILFYNQQIVIN